VTPSVHARVRDRMVCAGGCGRAFSVGEKIYRQRSRFGNKYYCLRCYPYGYAGADRRADAIKIFFTVMGAIVTFYLLDALIQTLV